MRVSCVSLTGSTLGEFDASLVKDLGLPTIGTDPGPVGSGTPGSSSTGSSSTGASHDLPGSSSGPLKFQLGETLPVVPAKLVRRVVRGDYIDMAEFTEDHLELELRRSLEGEDSKPTPLHKLRPVPDLLAWVRSFCHYAGIVAKTHPDKAVDLWAYLAIMLSGKDHGDWWRTYDSRFRQQWPSLEKAEFGRVDQALYTKAILSAGSLKPAQPPPSESSSLPKAKKRKMMVCFAWNDGRLCASTPCRYQHVCSRCAGDHRKSACSAVSEGQPSSATPQ